MIEKEIDYNTMSEIEAKDYFNKNYNIGYVDDSLPKPNMQVLMSHYIASALIYGIFVCLYLFCPFYDLSNTIKISNFKYITNIIAISIYFIYLILAPILLIIFKPKSVYVSHNIEVVKYIIKLISLRDFPFKGSPEEIINWIKPTYKQSQSLMLLFIKFFYAPQITTWAILHLHSGYNYWNIIEKYSDKIALTKNQMTLNQLCIYYRPVIWNIIINFLFFVDTFVYSIGYCTELTIFNNRIRTVETSIFGMFVCLICYSPFSSTLNSFIPLTLDENNFNISATHHIITWGYYLLAFILLSIYTLASLALFTKASNLTNRGTVSKFPYSVIRHPAYVTKLLFWWLSAIVLVKEAILRANFGIIPYLIMGMITISTIYYLRAITEERHLSKDPDYRNYMKKVKYRFIPFVW